ncbi:amphi-Trp domain-containing protein [Natronolimnobius sp. AArcel1]|uniref:amphi-Trp domain-containing protein n=1 Tax=Natronolimnobius sp. AArcel1 TaxID=1679093 RepID=UPI0013EC1E3A|nr:amphi-Trp domain-containing protein [Natronolimnobius sp. AArcel1]NGM70897.1 amphi-Trp domain-containing protein [Natronolimnobius sp. AArcel1]
MTDATENAPDADEPSDDRTVIRAGRKFEQEYRLDAADAGEFLIALGEQLRNGDELTISDSSGDEAWELPFAFGEPVNLEIEFDGMGDPELEIELELPGRSNDQAPQIE